MSDTRTHPDVGEVFVDHLGRVLLITSVKPNDPLGREVRGNLDRNPDKPYACNLWMWARTWRDAEPPMDPRLMKDG